MKSRERTIEKTIKRANDRIEGEEEIIEEIVTLSHHTRNNRSKSKAAAKWCYSLVMISARGHLIIRNEYVTYLPNTVFKYMGQDHEGRSIITCMGDGHSHSLPADCLIFI